MHLWWSGCGLCGGGGGGVWCVGMCGGVGVVCGDVWWGGCGVGVGVCGCLQLSMALKRNMTGHCIAPPPPHTHTHH